MSRELGHLITFLLCIVWVIGSTPACMCCARLSSSLSFYDVSPSVAGSASVARSCRSPRAIGRRAPSSTSSSRRTSSRGVRLHSMTKWKPKHRGEFAPPSRTSTTCCRSSRLGARTRASNSRRWRPRWQKPKLSSRRPVGSIRKLRRSAPWSMRLRAFYRCRWRRPLRLSPPRVVAEVDRSALRRHRESPSRRQARPLAQQWETVRALLGFVFIWMH